MTDQQQHIKETLDTYARQAVPDDLDLWPAIQRQVADRQRRPAAGPTIEHRRRPSPRLAGLALAALVVVFGLAWGLRPEQASAAVILERASVARGDASVFGLSSFAGHIEGQGSDPSANPPASYTFASDVRFQDPGRVRLDQCVTPAGMPQTCHLVVSNGTTGWLYLGAYQRAWSFTTDGPGGVAFVAADQRSLIIDSNEMRYIQVLGSEAVAGREAYVIEIAPTTGQTDMQQTEKIWIDKEYYVELRHESRDAQGNMIVAWSYTFFEPNPTISAAAFDFSPPEGVVVEQGYPLNSNVMYITPELRFVVQVPAP